MRLKPYAAAASFVLLLFILAFSFLTKLAYVPIRIWDEGRVVTNALNMYLNGNWIVTHFDGKPDMWNTKPPLLIWLQVLSMKLFGISEWSVRFPSAMASMLTGLTLWYFCKRYFHKPWLGFVAGCVLASTYPYIFNHAGRTGDYDALLTLFNTLYCISFYLFCKTTKNKWLLSFFTFLTLAALTKGIAGLLLTPALFIYAVTQKRLLLFLKNKWLYAGAVSFLCIVVGYYFLRDHYNPGYIKAVWKGELGSYPKTLNKHNHPFLWYITNIITWRYPYWFLFVIPAFVYGFLSSSEKVRSVTLFNLTMVVPFLFIISIAKTKLFWYDLPVYPFLSLQIGLMLYSLWLYIQEALEPFQWQQKIVAALFLFMLIFTIPFKRVYTHNRHISTGWPWDLDVAERNEGLFIQQAIRHKQDLNNYVFCYDACDRCHGQIDFYITLLRSKNVNVRFQENLDSLTPGSYVVVSQPEMKERLESSYHVQKEKEAYGCFVYKLK
ncbi:MAG: glycosyltransferase family 39 protein [Flavisolibacter sp.]|nr:glycosyltransferase family 39 protein [Flavisolibacter sp.]